MRRLYQVLCVWAMCAPGCAGSPSQQPAEVQPEVPHVEGQVVARSPEVVLDVAPPARIKTGDLLSGRAPSQECNDRDIAGVNRWLDSNPHTPLALAAAGGVPVVAPDRACCAAWGAPEVPWTQVDAFGRGVSVARVREGVGYDVTQCYELEMEHVEVLDPAGEGVGLYVSGEASGYVPARPHVLSAKDEAALRGLVEPLYRAFQAPYPDRAPLVFHSHLDESQPSRYPVCAAYGGALLVVMCKADDTWKVTYLEHTILTSYDSGAQESWLQRLNTPLSVFDMNGDGVVELVVHQTEGSSWHDIVLAYEEDEYEPWRRVVESVGGATI